MKTRLFLLPLLSLLLTGSVLFAAEKVTAAKPSLCFVTEWCNGEAEDVPLVEELRKAGFLVDSMGIENLTPEKMRQYHALIFPEFPRTDPHLTSSCAWQVQPGLLETFNPAIDDYVKSGGGVVVYGVCFFQTQLNGMEAMNKMMAPWGATTLFEQVFDGERQYHYKELFAHEYCWTENLAKHPLTEGLKRCYYPADGQHGPTTCPFKLSPEWTVVVRGEAGARSVPANPVDGAEPEFFRDQKGSYASAPPLVAVRQYGQGRIAVIGLSPVIAVFGGRFFGYGNVLLDAGDGTQKSDYGKLQERIYGWVAEPGVKSGTPGGFEEKPFVRPPSKVERFNWKVSDEEEGEPPPAPYRGLIGARTKEGGGSGSVAEYVAAAANAGLRFVVFTEDFDKLTPEKWDAFRKTCREATTGQVVAVPGILYRDNLGARFVAAGDFTFPSKARLSADGKRIADPMWAFDVGPPFVFPVDVGHNPRPFWTYSIYFGMAVKTYENGKLVDDATAPYLDREEVEDLLAPVVVDLIGSPAAVATSATHWTGVLVRTNEQLQTAFTRGASNGPTFFASTGPSIGLWNGINLGRVTDGSWDPIPSTERLAVRFRVTSEAGIKSVRLLDGPHLLRRFDAAGATVFKRTVHLLHDRQRHLILAVDDAKGNTAISGQLSSGDQLNVRHMCGDRGNTIDYSRICTDQGRIFINGPVAPYQRKNTMFSFFPGYCDLPTKYAAPYVDGGLRPVGHVSTPQVLLQGSKPQEGTFASRMAHPMSSRDVIIQQSDLVGWYTNQFASAWVPAEPVMELKDFSASVRWLDFGKRYHDPGFTLVEGTITFLRNGTLADDPLNPSIHLMLSGSSDQYTPQFSVVGLESREPLQGKTSKEQAPEVNGRFGKGGFVALYPCPWGAGSVIPLEPGYMLRAVMARPQTYVWVGLPMGGQKVTKGQKVGYRLLAGRGILGAEPTDQEWRDFCAAMGLSGNPAYTPEATQGKILNSAYLLEGETADYGFAAKIAQAKLTVRLPICVHPVNPKWTAAIANVADGSFLPVGVIETEQKAYATWDASRAAAEIYVGNLVMCDSPHLILTALATGKKWEVDVHNPTEKVVAATVKGAAKFPPLAGLNQKVQVPPGQSVVVTIPNI